MNLYTFAIRSMAASTSIEHHYEEVVKRLHSVISTLDELMEDSLFMDNIHGEQEIYLDHLLEMLNNVVARFQPAPPEPEFRPQFEEQSFDAD